jgi:hypothetical protein
MMNAIGKRRAELILTTLANSPGNAEKYPEIDVQMEAISRISTFIRRAWIEEDDRRFDWYLRHILITYEQGALTIVPDDPPERATAFDSAIVHLRRYRSRALRCKNPECQAPYFFAKEKAQKFCGGDCALPTQRESKRKWWADHGKAWTAEQKAKKAKKAKNGEVRIID